jgi:hypothetical protein
LESSRQSSGKIIAAPGFIYLNNTHFMSPNESWGKLNELLYRLTIYLNNNFIDDPAMLAIIFC